MENARKPTRLDTDTLQTMLRRQKNNFFLSNVDYAIFETDGTLSVLEKQNKQYVTKAT